MAVLNKKGQILGFSMAYGIFMFLVALLVIGGVLIILSENILGTTFHSLAQANGTDSTMLDNFEIMRKLMPLFVVAGLGLGLIALAIINSGGGQ